MEVKVGAFGEGREDARNERVLDGARRIQFFLKRNELLTIANCLHHLRA